ncbi:MAG: sigma-70 family RNA polymerase sigma factor [Anaerolineales bacterium]
MDYQKLDDATLLRFITRADEGALGELYDRYSRLVYSMALNSTGDAGLAEEITQDVYLRIWNKAATYQSSQGKVTTWIVSITRYRAIDMMRRLSVRPEGNRADWIEGEAIEASDPMDIEEQVENAERQQRVRSAVSELPEEQRAALSLAFFQGYSHSEIAEILGEPLGTVKTRIRLGMQKLRQSLQH